MRKKQEIMRNEINTLSELLEKLGKIKYNKGEEKELKDESGFKVSYRLKLSLTHDTIQAVIRVAYKGEVIQIWGAEDMAQTNEIVKWFLTQEYKVHLRDSEEGRRNEKIGNIILNNL